VRGVFVALEGIDGSGTSTQAAMIHESLVAMGRRSVLTTEPTQGSVGNVIRQIMTGRLLCSRDSRTVDRFLAYLFATDRFDHLNNDVDGILQYLAKGIDVVSTRYYFSSLAYHVVEDGDLEFVSALNAGFREPDLAIYLDCPLDAALGRLTRSRQLAERYENANKLALVKRNYDSIFDAYKGRAVRVDASLDKEEQHRVIMQTIADILPGRDG
jgi:dTMP kinase